MKFYVSDAQGKEIVLSEAGPGEYFGEISLDEGPRSASVMTLEPTRFSIIPREDFRDFLAQSPEFAFNLIAKWSLPAPPRSVFPPSIPMGSMSRTAA